MVAGGGTAVGQAHLPSAALLASKVQTSYVHTPRAPVNNEQRPGRVLQSAFCNFVHLSITRGRLRQQAAAFGLHHAAT